jgi:hypothetical protein
MSMPCIIVLNGNGLKVFTSGFVVVQYERY